MGNDSKSKPSYFQWLEENDYGDVDDIGKKSRLSPRHIIRSAPSKPENLRTMPYRDYLHTNHWQQIRLAALARAGYRCQLCNSSNRLEVHHRTYARRGAEQDSDVIVLCERCHTRFHQTQRNPRKRSQPYRRRKSSVAPGIIVLLGLVGLITVAIYASYSNTATERRITGQTGTATAQTAVANTVIAAAATTNATVLLATLSTSIPITTPQSPTHQQATISVLTRNDDGSVFSLGGICPAGFPIKGNDNSGIYHVPGQQYYDVTNARHCFPTEEEAQKAGYRKSQV
jgi:hypothetical protein